ncbi:Smr domain - like 1 [Theobroma cacao]|nr:Smr domain - like 1 [Theobroma cacao]
MSSTRGKGESSGWSAFDLKQRQKQGLVPETEDDPFPPMPNSLPAICPCINLAKSNDLSARSFSSVLKPSDNCPTSKQNKDYTKPINMGKPIENDGDKVVEQNNNNLALKKLKELHCWAENSLIEDVLLAADGDIHEASALLKGMMSISGTEDIKETKNNEMSSAISDFPGNAYCDREISTGKTAKLVCQSSKADEREDNLDKLTDMHENKLFDDASNMKLILGQLTSASQHSRAASNAFLRGDHVAAQQHSQNAREEWLAAQRLNAKAASEILRIRNSDNDLWKLDLHGLHAAEAVQALHEHLRRLETQVPAGRSVSPNRFKANNRIVHSSSVETFSSMDKLDKQQTSSRQRPTSLQVITGVGNHSRGQAALPAAVRSFLIENG